jgi:hypothetical protein
MEATCSSEIAVNFQRTTWRQVPETTTLQAIAMRTSNPKHACNCSFFTMYRHLQLACQLMLSSYETARFNVRISLQLDFIFGTKWLNCITRFYKIHLHSILPSTSGSPNFPLPMNFQRPQFVCNSHCRDGHSISPTLIYNHLIIILLSSRHVCESRREYRQTTRCGHCSAWFKMSQGLQRRSKILIVTQQYSIDTKTQNVSLYLYCTSFWFIHCCSETSTVGDEQQGSILSLPTRKVFVSAP